MMNINKASKIYFQKLLRRVIYKNTSEDNNSLQTSVDIFYRQPRIKYFKSHLINMAEPRMHFMLKAIFFS